MKELKKTGILVLIVVGISIIFTMLGLLILKFPANADGKLETNVVLLMEKYLGYITVSWGVYAMLRLFCDFDKTSKILCGIMGSISIAIMNFISNIIICRVNSRIDDGMWTRNIGNMLKYFIVAFVLYFLLSYIYKRPEKKEITKNNKYKNKQKK